MSNVVLSRREFLRVAGTGLMGAASVALPRKAFARGGAPTVEMEPLPLQLLPDIKDREVPVGLGLLIDASNSVDKAEFDLQVSGTANALRSDQVRNVILRKGAVGICATQFSLATQQTVGHALLTNEESIDIYANYIERQSRIYQSATEIANALTIKARIMSQSPYDKNVVDKIIDISGDDKQTITTPFLRKDDNEALRATSDHVSVNERVTINGLSIMTDVPDLDEYYKDCVVTSEAAWNKSGYVSKGRVWGITDYRHFETAMINKLSSELASNEHNNFGNPKQFGRILRFA